MYTLADMHWLVESNPPATIDAIREVESKLSLTIPDAYREFLLLSDGGRGSYSTLFGTDYLATMTQAHQVQDWAPEYLCIGHTGGAFLLLMKAEKHTAEFLVVLDDDIVVFPLEIESRHNFTDWLLTDKDDDFLF